MSKLMLRPSSKKLSPLNQQGPTSQKKNKKKSNSQTKYFQAPDIITQVKPSYLNNFIQPMNPHQSAFTPSNHSNLLKEETYLLPQKSSEFYNKKTLILDLDETLVHSSFTPFENNDIVLNVDFDGIMYNIYVLVRPGAENFIKNVSQYFEVVIFTASLSNYASPLLDILDPENNIKYRLYRDHCTFINGIYIKDLKKLNRNLKDLIIVDNSPLAYAFDMDNGLPIKTWYEDPTDIELIKITKLLEFLSKIKDVRKYIKKFVKENEILYEEALSFIKNFENKNKNIRQNNNNINNNSFVSKTNATNNLNSTGNNDNNTSNLNNTGNINTINKMNNTKDNNNNNIYFNLNPINICASSFEASKNQDSKKNIIKYKVNKDNKNKNNSKENIYKNANENKINNNKTLKSDITHNPQIKKNIFSLHDIAVMNNIIKKQQSDNFEEAKLSEKIVLINNGKQKQKTNNIFRFGQKNENKNNNINNNIFYNNKFSSLIPMALTSSNTTKNLLPHQNFFQFNNINNKNYDKIPNINKNENKEKLKNNYINLIQDKKQNNNKKNKYTNLLNKYGNDKIKSYYQKIIDQNKNILKYEKFGLGNLRKSAHLRISSSIPSHRNFASINYRNKNYDKNFTPFHYQRSKSTGHFFKLGKQNKLSPKTPNRQIIFPENDNEIEKQQNYYNLFNGFYLANTTKFKNFQNIAKNEGDLKFKRSKSSKRK